MREAPVAAATGLAMTLVRLARPTVPAMVVLLVYGVAVALWGDPALRHEVLALRPSFRTPSPTWPSASADAHRGAQSRQRGVGYAVGIVLYCACAAGLGTTLKSAPARGAELPASRRSRPRYQRRLGIGRRRLRAA